MAKPVRVVLAALLVLASAHGGWAEEVLPLEPADAEVEDTDLSAAVAEGEGEDGTVEVGDPVAGEETTGSLPDVEIAEPVGDGNAETQLALPMLVDARVSTTPERGRLVLDLPSPTQYAIASIDLPDRIVVDVRAAGIAFTPGAGPAGTGIVSGYQIEQPEPGRVRATLMLASPAQVQQAYVLEPFSDQPARLVVDLVAATPEEFARNVADDLAATLQQEAAGGGPASGGGAAANGGSRPLVVIDPGHGGYDNGASTANALREKDIVLAFSR